jgi:hypothetical protein
MPKHLKKEEADLVVIDEPWTPEERTAFSAFLKKQKVKEKQREIKLKTKAKKALLH